MELQEEGERSWDRANEWVLWRERDEKWFEACRCFHILKEIDICVHSDADCTARLQINNHNHKTPQDWLSIELSFFSLWQIWILLLQGSQMTLLSSVLWVCACAFVYLRVEGIQISLSQWTMSIIWSVCVGAILWQCIDPCFCVRVCVPDCVCACVRGHGLRTTTGRSNWIFIWALKSNH